MLYTARLEPNDGSKHFRLRTTEAPDIESARKLFEVMEDNRARYSVLDPRPVPVETDEESGNATVNLDALSVYSEQFGQGEDLLKALLADHEVQGKKVVGPNRSVRAHLAAHAQEQPWRIVSLEPVMPNVAQLVEALTWLHSNPQQWDRLLQELKDAGVPLAVVTASLYGVPWQKQIDGSAVTVWSSATIKNTLHTAYTLNQDTHDFYNDVSGTEIASGGGYTTGGNTLGTKTSIYDTTADQIQLSAAASSWASSTISATDAIVWVDTAGASSTDPVLGAIDFGTTVTTSSGTFQITWDSTGIVNFDIT